MKNTSSEKKARIVYFSHGGGPEAVVPSVEPK